MIRLAGALLSEQNDEWLVQRRYLSVESITLILAARRSEESTLEQPDKEVVALNAAEPPAPPTSSKRYTTTYDLTAAPGAESCGNAGATTPHMTPRDTAPCNATSP